MNSLGFKSVFSDDILAFLKYKQELGHPYFRATWTLKRFDRFIFSRNKKQNRKKLDLEKLILDWLSTFENCKQITISCELSFIRQFCLFLRRSNPKIFVPTRSWVPHSAKTKFLPHIFSLDEINLLLRTIDQLPHFQALTFRHLVFVLYCTGLRFGEALRLRPRDIDLKERIFFISESKGKSRWLPFGNDLSKKLRAYQRARSKIQPAVADSPFFLQANGRGYSTTYASAMIRRLLRSAGLKPAKGKSGPRPYDLRHAFAVHRLTLWYRAGIDIHQRLSWLSIYMGHDNILGTEYYLQVTPELLSIAGHRFAVRLGLENKK
jgi:integrase/recombinase XerD